MCLIAVSPRKGLIPRDHLQNAYDHNSHGWGIMYAQDGRVHTIKERSGMNRFFHAWGRVPKNVPVAVHFRFGTSGPQCNEMCHPFPVLNKKEHGIDLYLMHNGVLSRFNGDKTRSDTLEMVQECLTPLLCGQPSFIKNAAFEKICDAMIGSNNKLVFLDGNGHWYFVNKSAGHQDKQVWYSNEYSIRKVYSGFGKGKAANDTDSKFNWGAYDADNYYGSWNARRWNEPEKSGKALSVSVTKPTAIHVPAKSGTTVEVNAAPMKERTLETLSALDAAPVCPEKVAKAIGQGATLADSDVYLMMQHGIGLRELADYIFAGCEHVIKTAKGSVEGVKTLRDKAKAIIDRLEWDAFEKGAEDAIEDERLEKSRQFWQDANLKLQSANDIWDAVIDDPDGAADWILEKLGIS